LNDCEPSVTTRNNFLRLDVAIGKTRYKVGETLEVHLTLRNEREGTVTLVFPTSQIFDFSIEGVDNEFFYIWSSDKMFPQTVVKKELGCGESIQQTLEWTPNRPGTYAVKGYTTTFHVHGETFQLKTGPLIFKVTM